MNTTCTAADCDRSAHARGYCNKHYTRVMKHGDPNVLGQTGRPLNGDVPSWHAIHKRLTRERGTASDYDCVDCDGPAQEWSYDGEDPLEIGSPSGPYSLDTNRYEPRCIRCHRNFDASWEKRERTAAGTFAAREESADV